jgi:hypothetical protein
MDRINHQLTENRNRETSYNFLAATDWSGGNRQTVIAPNKSTNRLRILKITLSVTTDNAATQAWQTSNATPVIIARSKASPANGPITWDFGTEGWALPTGESLVHEMSAAGMAGAVTVMAYEEPVPNN